jgi:hypothetical protein
MVWRRRLQSISGKTAMVLRVNAIDQLNFRFRLRKPKSSRPNFIIKETILLPDDSTCSTRSSHSNQSSQHAKRGKHVHFNNKVVVILPSKNSVLTDDEAAAIWFTSTEISSMKNGLRMIWKGSHINDPDFIAAVDLVQKLFSGQVIVSDVAQNHDDTELDAQVKQIELYKECARILARNEGRGLERMHYGKSTFRKLGAKSLHVQRFVKSVLEVQDRQKDYSIESRSDAIAAQCQCLPFIWWARISAEVDAEMSTDDAMPLTNNILQFIKCTEAVKV